MNKTETLRQQPNLKRLIMRKFSALSRGLPLLVGVSCSMATLFLWQGLKTQELSQIQRKTNLEAASIKIELNNQIKQQIFALIRIAKRWETGGKPDQKAWEANATLDIEHFGSYQAIEWVDSSSQVRWIVPETGNEAAKNLNLASDKKRNSALLSAQKERQIKVTGTIDFVQGGKGFLVFVPMFRGKEFQGFILGVFRNHKFFDTVLRQNITQGYNIAIFAENKLIYYRAGEFIREKEQVKEEKAFPISAAQKKLLKEEEINLNGIIWRVRVWPTAYLLQQEQSFLPEVVLGVGIVMAVILSITVHLAQKMQARKSQLEIINQQLEDQIRERIQAEKAFQESQHFIQRIADATPNILYIYDLNEQRIIYNNGESQFILGYTPEEIKNLGDALFQNLLHPEDLAGFIERLKRLDTAKDGEVIETEYRLKHRLGEWRWLYSRDTIFSRTAAGKPRQILGTATDITKLKQMQEALNQANQELQKWVNQLEERNQEIVSLSELSDVLQACLSVEESYKVIAQMVQPLFPNISGGIFVTSASRKLVEAVAIWGENMRDWELAEKKFDFSHSDNYQSSTSNSFTSHQIFSPNECWALRRGKSHFLTREHSGLVCKHIHTRPDESLCVPMMAQGEALGIFYLSAPQPGQITESKQILAVTVAEHIALALANLKLRDTLQHQSIRDPLTGLFNRRYLEESLEREIHRAARNKQTLGVIMLDVDHFKRFNDTFGHDAGDVVLRELGLFLKKNIRGGDIACRYGGEEFTLIMPEVSWQDIQIRTEQMRQEVKRLNLQHQGQPLGAITLSLGVAIYPEHGSTREVVIQSADAALYRAKKEGRDRICLCT